MIENKRLPRSAYESERYGVLRSWPTGHEVNFPAAIQRHQEMTDAKKFSVEGPDGFTLSGRSSMAEISRDPTELVAQTIGPAHQYPDGLMLFLGTMFAPTQDRDAPGRGFTHVVGDLVTISTPKLGALANRVDCSDRVPPWTYGVRQLLHDLARR